MLHAAFTRGQRLRWTQPPHAPHHLHPRIFSNHLRHHHRPYRCRLHRYTRGRSGERRPKKREGHVPEETPSVTEESVGEAGAIANEGGSDRGSRADEHVVSAVSDPGGGMRAPCTQWALSTALLPPPHRRHRNRCPCGECWVRRGLSAPSEGGFLAKAALAVGLFVGALRWRGGGLQRCCRKRVNFLSTRGSVA